MQAGNTSNVMTGACWIEAGFVSTPSWGVIQRKVPSVFT